MNFWVGIIVGFFFGAFLFGFVEELVKAWWKGRGR